MDNYNISYAPYLNYWISNLSRSESKYICTYAIPPNFKWICIALHLLYRFDDCLYPEYLIVWLMWLRRQHVQLNDADLIAGHFCHTCYIPTHDSSKMVSANCAGKLLRNVHELDPYLNSLIANTLGEKRMSLTWTDQKRRIYFLRVFKSV